MKRLTALILIVSFIFLMSSFTSFESVKKNSENITFGELILDNSISPFEIDLCKQLHFSTHPEANVIIQADAYLPYGVMGVTYKISDSWYLMQLSGNIANDNERWWTMFHEWAHINQFRTSKLEETNEKQIMWMGAPADFSKKWDKRPWEIEADEMADRTWDRLIPYVEKPER